MKKFNTLAEGIRNQSFFLAQKNITDQDQKILQMLVIEKVADSWTLAAKTGIFITSARRSITNLKHSGLIKEVGSITSEVTGTRNTLYALTSTIKEEIDEWKRLKKIEDEKKFEEAKKLFEAVNATKQIIAEDYVNGMMKDYQTK